MNATPSAALRRTPAVALALTAIVMAGAALRVAWALQIDPVPFGDTAWYLNVAENLAHGRGFVANHHNVLLAPPDVPQPTAYYPPGYPFALAGVFKAFGAGVTSAKVLNAVLGTLTIPFVYGMGVRIFDRRAGLLAAALFALWPNALAWLPLPLSEPLFTLLFAAGLWLLLAAPAARPPVTLAGALALGALAGAAALTRGVGLVLLPIALVFWLSRDGARRALAQTGLALIATALVVAPWTVRNWAVLDGFIPIASNTGVNLRVGHAPEANGTFLALHDPVEGVPLWRSLDRPEWEVRANRVAARRALGYALGHPWRELTLAKDKLSYLYRSDAEMTPSLSELGGSGVRPRALADAFPRLIDGSWYGLLAVALLSAPLWLRCRPERLLPATALVLWTLSHLAFFGLARYHLPLLPLLAVAAAGGLAGAAEALRPAPTRAAATRPAWNPTRAILSRLPRPHRLGD